MVPFSKLLRKSPNIWATFVHKFVIKIFSIIAQYWSRSKQFLKRTENKNDFFLICCFSSDLSSSSSCFHFISLKLHRRRRYIIIIIVDVVVAASKILFTKTLPNVSTYIQCWYNIASYHLRFGVNDFWDQTQRVRIVRFLNQSKSSRNSKPMC